MSEKLKKLIKPETTEHERAAQKAAVKRYKKVKLIPFLRFSFLRIKSHVTIMIVSAESA